MKKWLLLLSIIALMPIFAEEEQDLPVRIDSIHWVLQNFESEEGAGFTRESSLYRAFRIEESDLFRSARHLERRLQRGKEDLEGRKIFKYISVEVYYVENEGILDATIYIYIVDRWNIVAFPRASYDTNLGLQFGGRIQYKNVLGSLIDFDVMGYWSKDQWDITSEISNLDLFFFQGNLIYTQHYENIYRFDNSQNLQTLYNFQTSEIKVKVDFPVLPGLEYYIMPGFLTTHSFQIEEDYIGLTLSNLEDEEAYFAAAFKHGVVYDRVKWNGNMRSGYGLTMDNRVEIPFNSELPQTDVDFSLSVYTHLEDFMGFSASFSGFRIFNGIRDNAGDRLRGIQDNLAYGEWGLYVNTAIESRSIHLPPVVDIHLQPFIDWGYMISPGEGLKDGDNWFLSGGFSMIFFPLPFSSLQISLIMGYDLLEPSPYEFGVYTGLFF